MDFRLRTVTAVTMAILLASTLYAQDGKPAERSASSVI